MPVYYISETQIVARTWKVNAESPAHARTVWENSGPCVELVRDDVTDSHGLQIECDGSICDPDDGNPFHPESPEGRAWDAAQG